MIQLFRKRCTRYSLKSGIDRRKQLIAIVSIPALRSFGCPLCDMVIPILTVGGCRQCQNHRKLLALIDRNLKAQSPFFFCKIDGEIRNSVHGAVLQLFPYFSLINRGICGVCTTAFVSIRKNRIDLVECLFCQRRCLILCLNLVSGLLAECPVIFRAG